MKKVVFALATALAVGVVFTGVAVSGNGGEVVDKGFACGVFDGNGNIMITTDSTLTVYQTKAVLRCTGNGAPAKDLTYFNYENTGGTCGMLQFGSTTDWSNKVGKAGNSQLTCTAALGPDSAASAGAGIG